MMSTKMLKVASILLFVLGLTVGIGYSYQSGPPAGRTGVPAGGGFPPEPTCAATGCHDSFPLNPDAKGVIELLGVPDNYIPGQQYALTFRITHPDPDRRAFGFQTTAVAIETYLGAGAFVSTEPDTTTIRGCTPADKCPSSLLGTHRQYIEHDPKRIGRGGASWNFAWIAPETNVGDIAFYGSGNAAGFPLGKAEGDKIYNPSAKPPHAPLALTKGQFLFVNIATQANVAAGRSQGAAVGDVDGDRLNDLAIVTDERVVLYRNNGDSTFTDVTASTGIADLASPGQAVAWGDYDGDGHLDLYVVTAGADILYRNNGDGTFTDVTNEAGIRGDALGHAAVWADLNGDGAMDVYVANRGQDALYLNNADGTFTLVDPATAGLAEMAESWDVAVADYDGDGMLDIFVANDGQDALYRNNGDGTFTEVATAAGIVTTNMLGLAAAWGDYDGDRDMDLFVANAGMDILFRNNGDGTFTDVTARAGMTDAAIGVAAAWADYDHDGDLDLFVANEGQDFLYRNNGDGTFNEVATYSGMTDMAVGTDALWLDVDGDGHPDLFVTNAGDENFLYWNPGRSGESVQNRLQSLNEWTISRVARLAIGLLRWSVALHAWLDHPWRRGRNRIIMAGGVRSG